MSSYFFIAVNVPILIFNAFVKNGRVKFKKLNYDYLRRLQL